MLKRMPCLTLVLLTLLLPSYLPAQKSSSTEASSTKTTAVKTQAQAAPKAKKKPPAGAPKKSAAPARAQKAPVARRVSAKKQFMIESGYPKGRPGYVVTYITPLRCGGADITSNMQWQSVFEAKAKDRAERNCRKQ